MMPIISGGASLTRHLIASEYLGPNAVHSQFIRWRKPLWLGTAKSKIFRVPPKQNTPAEEMAEIMRLHNNYRTYRESIRKYYMALAAQDAVQFDEEALKKAEEEDFARCVALNEEWNKRVANTREINHAERIEKRKQVVLENVKIREEEERKLVEAAEAKIRKVKAEAHTFITEADIDDVIAAALTNFVSYNVAIDKEGNRYEGKYIPPQKDSPIEERQRQAEQ